MSVLVADGWYLVATKGSHRQFKHPVKAGRITIAGHLTEDLAPGTMNCIFKQAPSKSPDELFSSSNFARLNSSEIQGMIIHMHRFLIVIEKAGKNYSAYSPDLPGCVATGKTREETKRADARSHRDAYSRAY